MKYSGASPSPSANTGQRCHYLGLRDDPETALGFPSNWNCCQHAKPITPPNLEHQRNFCLTTEHTLCPVFSAEQKISLPKDMRMLETGRQAKVVGRWIAVLMILLFLIGSALIFSGAWFPSWAERLPASEWISRAIPIKTEVVTSTPVIETDLPIENLNTDTPIPPPGDTASGTQTEPALISHCAHPMETPFGKNRQFLLHQVASGESMAMLTEEYKTSVNVIDAVNYFLPSPLWAELVIVIPVNITEVGDLSSFRPVLLDEDDISIEELADNLSVSPSELVEFNQMDLSCRSFHGWVLIPAEKINP